MIKDVEFAIKRQGRSYEVFKAIFDDVEYDMVIRNKYTRECELYEIKYS